MKSVYFACAIRAGGDTSSYQAIVTAIQEAGGEVVSEVFVNDAIVHGGSLLPENEIYARDIAMIEAADVVIAEVTNPSLGVGYELAYAQNIQKPILCLFNESSEKKLSAMVSGNPYNTIANYSPGHMPTDAIRDFIAR